MGKMFKQMIFSYFVETLLGSSLHDNAVVVESLGAKYAEGVVDTDGKLTLVETLPPVSQQSV